MEALVVIFIVLSFMVAASNPATMGFFAIPALMAMLALFLGRGQKPHDDI